MRHSHTTTSTMNSTQHLKTSEQTAQHMTVYENTECSLTFCPLFVSCIHESWR